VTIYNFVSAIAEAIKGKTARAEILRSSPADGWLYRGENLKVTLKDLEAIVANWKKYPRDIPLDYEHGTAYDDGPVGSAIAAGWLRELELKKSGDGSGSLWATFELTDRAAEWVAAGEYRLTSSEFSTDYVHPEAKEPIGPYLLAVGLTNRPFVPGLAPMTMLTEAAAKVMQLISTEHRNTEQAKTEKVVIGILGFSIRQGDK